MSSCFIVVSHSYTHYQLLSIDDRILIFNYFDSFSRVFSGKFPNFLASKASLHCDSLGTVRKEQIPVLVR